MTNQSLENAYAYAAQLMSKAGTLPRYIRRDELRLVVPLANTTIYTMEQRNEFPRRIYLTPKTPVWELAEVQAWIEQRKIASASMPTPRGPAVRKRKRRLKAATST